jgi:hypothetical protein
VSRPPEFRDLVDDDLTPHERERLERVHDLLVSAGPPPELPPALELPPNRAERKQEWLPRRRIGLALGLAAAIALVTFLGGYLAGYNRTGFEVTRQVAMHGTSQAPGAEGVIKLGDPDDGGNSRMRVTVRGLPTLPERGYYELYLTRGGKRIPCGGFNVGGGSTTLEFSVPYDLTGDDHWIVTRWDRDSAAQPPLLKT